MLSGDKMGFYECWLLYKEGAKYLASMQGAKTETLVRMKDGDVQRKITTRDWPVWEGKNNSAQKHGSRVPFVVDRPRKFLRQQESISICGEDAASYEDGLALTVEVLTLFLEELEKNGVSKAVIRYVFFIVSPHWVLTPGFVVWRRHSSAS